MYTSSIIVILEIWWLNLRETKKKKKKKTMCQQYSLYLFNFPNILWMKPD